MLQKRGSQALTREENASHFIHRFQKRKLIIARVPKFFYMCTVGYNDNPVIERRDPERSTVVLQGWLVGQYRARIMVPAFLYPSRITSAVLPVVMNLIPAHHEPSQLPDPTVGKAPS